MMQPGSFGPTTVGLSPDDRCNCARRPRAQRAGRYHRALPDGVASRLRRHLERAVLEQARIVQLLVQRVDVRKDALEMRIRTEGLASIIGELRQEGERKAA